MARDWRRFWKEQDDPHHPATQDFFLSHGRELSLIVGDPTGKNVLEFGCGSGALFQAIGFDHAMSYLGIDFSEKMLAAFHTAHPDAKTVCADASKYIDKQKYELIFSNAVAQYFDRHMLQRHITNARTMLAPGGTLIVGSVPWRGARASYHLNAYYPDKRRQRLRNMTVLVRSYFGIDRIGHWHSLRDFTRIARSCGLTATYFGCVQYPYRFHARLDAAQ